MVPRSQQQSQMVVLCALASHPRSGHSLAVMCSAAPSVATRVVASLVWVRVVPSQSQFRTAPNRPPELALPQTATRGATQNASRKCACAPNPTTAPMHRAPVLYSVSQRAPALQGASGAKTAPRATRGAAAIGFLGISTTRDCPIVSQLPEEKGAPMNMRLLVHLFPIQLHTLSRIWHCSPYKRPLGVTHGLTLY